MDRGTRRSALSRIHRFPVRLFQYFQDLPEFLLRRFQEVILVLSGPSPQFPFCTCDRITGLIEKLFYLEDVIEVLLGVETLT